jgi:acyl-CoA reductase-like NAD-dependent aldehyde dehydrogenase
VLVGGGTAGRDRGFYYEPAVVTGAPHETDLLREETFGPVAPIVAVDSLRPGDRHANATRYGLGASVYTRDLETAIRGARGIEATASLRPQKPATAAPGLPSAPWA